MKNLAQQRDGVSSIGEASPPNRQETQRVLAECRNLASNLLSQSLSTMMDKIESVLFELAEKTTDNTRSNLYLNARGLATKHREALEHRFQHEFMGAFDELSSDKPKPPTNTLDFGNFELSLVDDSDYEQSLAVKSMASKLRSNCSEELNDLDQRLGVLLHTPELDGADNPIAPQQICNAFKSACDTLEAELEVKLIMMRLFEQFVAGDVRTLYQELNQLLISRNVLPKIPMMVRKRPAANQGFVPAPAPTAQAAEMSSDMFASAVQNALQNAGVATGDFNQAQTGQVNMSVLQLLQQLVQPIGGAFPPQAMLAAGTHNSAKPLDESRILAALEKLQHGDVAALIQSHQSNFDWQAQSALAAPRLLHAFKEDMVAAGDTSQVEALTIDIVSMLFDFVFNERNIAADIKALLGRLQIPVLKVALLDAKFFSKKLHPARRLLDTLAHASMGWSADTPSGARYYQMVDRIVQTIITDFTDDIGIFETQQIVLDQFLLEEEHVAVEATRQSAMTILRQEQLEIGSALTTVALQTRLQKSGVPPVVRDYLAKHWGSALLHAYIQGGETGEAWRDTTQVMDDLIWSCEPKYKTEDRIQLVSLLQPMLRRLEDVMITNGATLDEKDKFLAEMVACHSAAIKSGMKPPQDLLQIKQPVQTLEIELPHRAEPLPLDSTELTPVTAQIIETHDINAPVSVMAAIDTPNDPLTDIMDRSLSDENTGSVDRNDWQVARLRRGMWVDFTTSDGEDQRLKLAWISPHKGIYLFTNRQGGNALSISPEGLATRIREQRAVIVDEGALLDRAVNAVMGQLQQETETA